jgi:hypothetical protein
MVIFEPVEEVIKVGWRKLHNDEFHNLYFPRDIVWVMKSKRVRWMGDVIGPLIGR